MGCIYSVKYLSGICLVGKCPSGICLVGEVFVGDVSGRGSVRRGCVWSGKCPSGMCLVGEMSVGEVSVGEESVREMSVGDVSGNLEKNYEQTLYVFVMSRTSESTLYSCLNVMKLLARSRREI